MEFAEYAAPPSETRTLPDLSALLGQLVDEERAEKHGKVPVFAFGDCKNENILDLEQSAPFQSLYQQTLNDLRVPRSDEEIDTFMCDFSGSVFEVIADSYIGSFAPSWIRLSKERTSEFFRALYLHHDREDHLDTELSQDIAMPDSLFCVEEKGETKIAALLKYTLPYNKERLEKILSTLLITPSFPWYSVPDAKLRVVVPQTDRSFSIEEQEEVNLIEVPFTREVLQGYFQYFYHYYRRDEGQPTLAEVQEGARGRTQALQSLLHSDKLFRQMYDQAIVTHRDRVPLDDKKLERAGLSFFKNVFRVLAYDFLATQKSFPGTLFTPQETAQLLFKFKPDVRIDKDQPDGIIVENCDGKEQIVALCDYSFPFSKDPAYFQKRIEALQQMKKRFVSPCADDVQFLFVVPQDFAFPESVVTGGEVAMIRLPYTNYQLEDIFLFLYTEYRQAENRPTLVEYQKLAQKKGKVKRG